MIINKYGKELTIEDKLASAPLHFVIQWQLLEKMQYFYSEKKLEDRIIRLEQKQNRYCNAQDTADWLKHYYKKKGLPLFSSVEIETVNRCNGTCSFCPVNKNAESRKFKKMDEKLFYKIIDELGELHYRGRVALHSNNEPFIDTRIIEFAKYAREKLPHAFLYLYTNGTLLSVEKLEEIMKYLNKIYIDNYDDALQLSEPVQKIHEYCLQHKELNRRVEIHLRKINEILYTRGGQSPNNTKKEVLNSSCILPFKQMVIRPDGKCSLCCNDPLGKNTLGDIQNSKMEEIWYGNRYNQVRKSLSRGRKYVSLCKYCDTLANVEVY